MRTASLRAFLTLLLVGACEEHARTQVPLDAGAQVRAGSRTATAAASNAAWAPPPPATEGKDFTQEVKLLFRVAACSGDAPVPPNVDPAALEKHCDWLRAKMAAYRKDYLGTMKPFLASLEPKDVPTTVVYPFGGGDLLSALTTYPDAHEVTTLSLEYAGDPRRIETAGKARLTKSLERLRKTVDQLLTVDDSASEDLMQVQRGEIPGQLAFFLIALAVHGFEPTSLRYFTLLPDGSIHYLGDKDFAERETRTAKKLNPVWKAPDFSEAFANLELRFRRPGEPERIHRHIAINLDDSHLKRDPRVLKHLEAKGRVAVLVKAASYLLWGRSFSRIEDYLLEHAAIMFSDSSGVPPSDAKRAGFTEETYGTFEGTRPDIKVSPKILAELKALWASEKARPLPFRYGYGDVKKRPHMIVSRRAR